MKWCLLWLYLNLPLWLDVKLVLVFSLRQQIKVASLSAEVDSLCTLILAEALKSSAALWPSWQLDQHTAQMHCLNLLIKGWEQRVKGYKFSLRFQLIGFFPPTSVFHGVLIAENHLFLDYKVAGRAETFVYCCCWYALKPQVIFAELLLMNLQVSVIFIQHGWCKSSFQH